MTSDDLRKRTAKFAAGISRLARSWLVALETRHAAQQLIRASSSVAANYRAACRARSHAEFTAKLGLVLEEADESLYWLEHLGDAGLVPGPALAEPLSESRQLVAIFTTAVRTARSKHTRKPAQPARDQVADR